MLLFIRGNGLETDPSYRRSSYTYVAKPRREFHSKPEPTSPVRGEGSNTPPPPSLVAPAPVAAPPSPTPPAKPRKNSLTVGAPKQPEVSVTGSNSSVNTSSSAAYHTAVEGAATVSTESAAAAQSASCADSEGESTPPSSKQLFESFEIVDKHQEFARYSTQGDAAATETAVNADQST